MGYHIGTLLYCRARKEQKFKFANEMKQTGSRLTHALWISICLVSDNDKMTPTLSTPNIEFPGDMPKQYLDYGHFEVGMN